MIWSQYKRFRKDCPCKECIVGMVCTKFCEKRLEYNPVDLARKMEEVRSKIERTSCWCGYEGLDNCHVNYYEHQSGFRVGINTYWMFIRCPKCHHDWALWKLGVHHDV